MSCPYAHQHNGVAQYKYRRIMDITCFLLLFGSVAREFLAYAIFTVVYLISISCPRLLYQEFLLMSIFILSILHMHAFISWVASVLFCFLCTTRQALSLFWCLYFLLIFWGIKDIIVMIPLLIAFEFLLMLASLSTFLIMFELVLLMLFFLPLLSINPFFEHKEFLPRCWKLFLIGFLLPWFY